MERSWKRRRREFAVGDRRRVRKTEGGARRAGGDVVEVTRGVLRVRG
jgi:hypothetical protein